MKERKREKEGGGNRGKKERRGEEGSRMEWGRRQKIIDNR